MPPTLTQDQRAEARDRALVARRQRSHLKTRLGSGELSFLEVLSIVKSDNELGRAAGRLRVGEVLLSLPKVGEAKADAVLVAAGVNGSRRVRGLGPRQVDRLVAGLDL